MSQVCQVTRARPGFGNHVSHSHRRTKRRFDVNVQRERYRVPSLRRNVSLRVSARGIKTIDQRGIEAVVADLLPGGADLMARKGSDGRPVVARYAERRAQLKERVRREAPGSPELADAARALSRLPRDASPVRLRNRDQVDGRPRGYLRKTGLSRIRFRELAHRGELPGIRKSSW